MRRYIESLFAHKLLFLLPLIVVPIVVVGGGLALSGDYEVTARIWVSEQPFLDPSDVGVAVANQREAQALQERLSTKAFRLDILDRAGLTEAVQNAEWPERGGVASWPLLGPIVRGLGLVGPMSSEAAQAEALRYIQRSVSVDARGNNLITVSYRGDDPALGVVLVESTISVYKETFAESVAQRGSLAVDFYQERVEVLGMNVADSAQELREFLETHPLGYLNEPRPPEEELELAELQRQYDMDRALYETAMDRLEQARAAAQAGQELSEGSFQVIDPPEAPMSGTIGRRTVALVTVGGLAAGAGLGIVAIVVAAWTDTSVRNKEDLALIFDSPVVAVVPRLKLRGARAKGGTGHDPLHVDVAGSASPSEP